MEEPLKLVLIGGAVSLISTLAGAAFQNWFELIKQTRETRRYPTQILFNKQVEFYDKIAKFIPKVHINILTIHTIIFRRFLPDAPPLPNAQLSPIALMKLKSARMVSSPLAMELHHLVQQCVTYLPKQIIDAANTLEMNLARLTSENVTTEDTDRCMDCFFVFS